MPITFQLRGSQNVRQKLNRLESGLRGRTLERATVAAALVVQNDAKRRVPFLTGTLQRSIHIGGHADKAPDFTGPDGLNQPEVSSGRATIYVGTDLEYAQRIEYGFQGEDRLGRHYNQQAQPYLRPALDENRAAVEREFAEALRDLIEALDT